MSHLQGLQKGLKKFRDLGVSLVAISVDPLDKTQKVHEKLGLAFDLLSDSEFKTIGKYGVTHKKPLGISHPIARPSEFLIRPDGTIAHIWAAQSTFQRTHVDEIIKVLNKEKSGK